MMGMLAAAIFAGQMLNFAVAGGTSGHLMGAALATILLGPWAAVLVLTSVVSIQALIFQDGGLLALGANIFNMGIVGVAVGYMAYHTVKKLAGGRKWGLYLGGFIAAWLSIEVAALSVALQLALSNTSPANLAIPAMAGVHALIGTGEGLITVGALASARPDGLERIAGQLGFLDAARASRSQIIPDYVLPGVSNTALATILAGIIGVLIVFGVTLAVGYPRRSVYRSEHLSERPDHQASSK